MINRVLIRIKVVQMLYCYLLSQNEFKIEPAPDESASRDKKYAYSLYLDLLMMVLELSGYNVRARAAPRFRESPPTSIFTTILWRNRSPE